MQLFESSLCGADRPLAPKGCPECGGSRKLWCHGTIPRCRGSEGNEQAGSARYYCVQCSHTWSVIPADIKTLSQQGVPLAECLRVASSRPWPGEDGFYYSYRTIETWWYRHQRHGFPGLTGKAVRGDAGKSRAIDEETGLWIIEAVSKSPDTALSVLYRHWQDHGRGLPSLSSVVRFLKVSGYDRRSIKAGCRSVTRR